jgi:hypothetical protein
MLFYPIWAHMTIYYRLLNKQFNDILNNIFNVKSCLTRQKACSEMYFDFNILSPHKSKILNNHKGFLPF